jgi:hypothetical protein
MFSRFSCEDPRFRFQNVGGFQVEIGNLRKLNLKPET